MDYIDLVWTPDLDCFWGKNPGALTLVNLLVPTQYGALASSGASSLFALSGGSANNARLFRQVNNSVRMLTFSGATIDEYDNAGVKTNRGAGYTGNYWDAAAWGNQIIACNGSDAVQSSAGAGFAALGGGSGKARYIAGNLDQMVLYDVDDGLGYAFQDAVAWSQFRNPSSYTPDPRTQAGRTRLLSVPGPARGIVAYQNGFVAFKDNGFFVGRYVGPQKVMSWVPVSKRVGCIAPFSITECDGKLYWLHSSGFWEWDGQHLTNVGKPVIQSFTSENAYFDTGRFSIGAGGLNFDITNTQGSADDVDGVVMFSSFAYKVGPPQLHRIISYFYNVRTGRWGRWKRETGASAIASPLMRATSVDLQAFKKDTGGRFWQIVTEPGATTMYSLRYPYGGGGVDSPSFTTGLYGDQLQSARQDMLVLRHAAGTDSLAIGEVTGDIGGFSTPDGAVSGELGAAPSLTWNVAKSALMGSVDAPFKQMEVFYNSARKIILAGAGIPQKPTGTR